MMNNWWPIFSSLFVVFLLNPTKFKLWTCIETISLFNYSTPPPILLTMSLLHWRRKKKGNGKNINNEIVVGGGGSWKELNNSKSIYDMKHSVIGFKKTFRFDEGTHVLNMKEYRLTNGTLTALTRSHQIRKNYFVVCRIMRSSNLSHAKDNFVTQYLCPNTKSRNCKIVYSISASRKSRNSEIVYSIPVSRKYKNCKIARNSIWGKEYHISQVSNATQLPLMNSPGEECSVPSISSNDDIARYHR